MDLWAITHSHAYSHYGKRTPASKGRYAHAEPHFGYRATASYGETRIVLRPRWFVATRLGYIRPNIFPGWRSYEAAVGFRPGAHELVKVEYEIEQGPAIHGTQKNTLAIQFVTTLPPLSISRR